MNGSWIRSFVFGAPTILFAVFTAFAMGTIISLELFCNIGILLELDTCHPDPNSVAMANGVIAGVLSILPTMAILRVADNARHKNTEDQE